jgi:tRNA(fMet)-specific endonuclease VapC
MTYMLDTNICIYLIKRRPQSVVNKFQSIAPGDISISSVTVAEMLYGVEKSEHKEKNRAALTLFLAPLEIVNFDIGAARSYGAIRADLEAKGAPIGAYDLMIAAHASSLGLILVTNHLREFSSIPDLIVENWVS